jgi:hypothetical protein
MPYSRTPAEREKLIKTSLDFFIEYFLPKRTAEIQATVKSSIQISIIKNAETVINEHYAKLMETYFAPYLTRQNDINIDLYKMLSVTEYAVLEVHPFVICEDKGHVPTNEHERLVIDERILNAHFAFNCALIMLSNTEGKYKKLFSDPQIMNHIIHFKEESDSIGEEHVATLAQSDIISPFPLFSNATWWQLFCYAGTLLEIDNPAHPFKEK